MHNFKYLDAWNVAVDVAVAVYRLARTLPADDRLGMAAQLPRSSTSIATNIQEGSASGSSTEFKPYLMIG